MNNFNRRRFLKIGTQALTTAGLALGANPMLSLANAAEGSLSAYSDYRALVCIYLQGGCDGFSLLVPTDNAEYNEYESSRRKLAVPRSKLLDMSNLSGTHPNTGLHPNAAALRPLYEDGRLAMIANVGNLIVPTSQEQYENHAVPIPAQLFSHSDQSIQWQQLQGRDSGTQGWGAIAASYLAESQQRDYLTSITLAGSNYWQSGFGQKPFSLKETGVLNYDGLDRESEWQKPRAEAFQRVMQQPRSNLFASAYADVQNRAMQVTAELGEVLESNGALVIEQPDDNSLAAQLGMVAQLIAAHEQLGMHRQIFYVRMSGFDVHDNQNNELPDLFTELSEALAFFQGSLDQMGQSQNVTTFTASDFGRTLTSNGDGTDHGWGNHLMALGGAVKGGEIYGTLPRLSVDGPDSVHNGRILPTLSASQYAATLLQWAGLEDQQLSLTLPTLANFSQRNVGFMA